MKKRKNQFKLPQGFGWAALCALTIGCELSAPKVQQDIADNDDLPNDEVHCTAGTDQISLGEPCYPVIPVYIIPSDSLPNDLEQVPTTKVNESILLTKPSHLIDSTSEWQVFAGDSLGFYSYHQTLSAPGEKIVYAPNFPGVYYFKLCSQQRCLADALLQVTGLMNLAPEATLSVEGEPIVFLGSSIQISASDSYDPEGDALSFEWTAIDPDGETIELAESDALLGFAPDVPGTYRINTRVLDGFENPVRANVQTDFVFIYARLLGNAAPQAVADAPLTVQAGQPLSVDLTGSIDNEGDTLSVRWDLFRYDPVENFYDHEASDVAQELIFDINPMEVSEYVLFLRVDDYVERNCSLESEALACTSVEFAVVAGP